MNFSGKKGRFVMVLLLKKFGVVSVGLFKAFFTTQNTFFLQETRCHNIFEIGFECFGWRWEALRTL